MRKDMVRVDMELDDGRVLHNEYGAETVLYELAGALVNGMPVEGEWSDQGYQITVQASVKERIVYHIPD